MAKKEDIGFLSSHSEKDMRFNLPVRSFRYEYIVNAKNVRNLARYLGFAQVKILSSGLASPGDRKEKSVFSKVGHLPVEENPLKARWKSIEIYIDVPKITQSMPYSYTDKDKELQSIIQDLIKSELYKEGKRNLKTVDAYGLFIDVGGSLLLAFLLLLAIDFSGLDKDQYRIHALFVGVVLKCLISLADSATHYLHTTYKARLSLFEGTNAERIIGLEEKVHSSKLIYLRPKED